MTKQQADGGYDDMARFYARLTKEQKELFEYASNLGGFRSLTEFIIQSAQNRAKEIIEAHTQMLASQREQEILIDAITNPAEPDQELKSAFPESISVVPATRSARYSG